MSNENESVNGVYLCSSTNSTFFTECCNTAICDNEQRCPKCHCFIIGWDRKPGNQRNLARWNYAYRRKRRL